MRTDTATLKRLIDLRSLVAETHKLVRGVARCPFHDEKTGSFHVWKDHYHCFGCGARGDAITWLMALHSIPFREAVAELERRCGVKAGERIVKQPMESEILAAEAAEWYAARNDPAYFDYMVYPQPHEPREIVAAYRSVRCAELRAMLAENLRDFKNWERALRRCVKMIS